MQLEKSDIICECSLILLVNDYLINSIHTIFSASRMWFEKRSPYMINHQLTRLQCTNTTPETSSGIFCEYCLQDFRWDENLKDHDAFYCQNETNPNTQKRESAQKILGFKLVKDNEKGNDEKTSNSPTLAAFFQTRNE